jgi:hypothetical protein
MIFDIILESDFSQSCENRDWMPNFDPNCPTFSVNVFNNRDLTPPMSNFGPNRNKRKDDEMSPLLEFNESDAILDNTMQSCLSANKGYLVKRYVPICSNLAECSNVIAL